MKFNVKDFMIDLGTTPLENIFINNYFQIASGDQIKVYIYCYKLAYEGLEDLSPQEISNELGLDLRIFEDSLDFWEDQGIITKTQAGYSFLSIRELYLGIDFSKEEEPAQQPVEPPAEPEERILPTYSNLHMFSEIEEIIGTKLTPNEIERILAHLKEHGQDEELIAYGFTYSDKTTNKRNVNYVLSILRNWAIDGILTIADYKKAQEEREARNKPPAKKRPRKSTPKNEGGVSGTDIKAILDRKLREDMERAQGGSDERE